MMALYIPRCVGMRYETLIDDGRTGIIEWVHIVSDAGYEERGRVFKQLVLKRSQMK